MAELSQCKWFQDSPSWHQDCRICVAFLEAGSFEPVRPYFPGSGSKEILSGEMEGDGIEGEKLQLEEEDQFVRKLKDPKLPSQDEVDKHFLMGHFPYRDWCTVCVKAHGKELDHRRDSQKERDIPEYSFDFCFPGDELGFKWTVLVGRERMSKSVMCTTIANKGGGSKFSLDKCVEFFEENGDRENRIIVKNDQEPSIQFLMKDLVEERKDGQTLVEESAKHSSGSSGRRCRIYIGGISA